MNLLNNFSTSIRFLCEQIMSGFSDDLNQKMNLELTNRFFFCHFCNRPFTLLSTLQTLISSKCARTWTSALVPRLLRPPSRSCLSPPPRDLKEPLSTSTLSTLSPLPSELVKLSSKLTLRMLPSCNGLRPWFPCPMEATLSNFKFNLNLLKVRAPSA